MVYTDNDTFKTYFSHLTLSHLEGYPSILRDFIIKYEGEIMISKINVDAAGPLLGHTLENTHTLGFYYQENERVVPYVFLPMNMELVLSNDSMFSIIRHNFHQKQFIKAAEFSIFQQDLEKYLPPHIVLVPKRLVHEFIETIDLQHEWIEYRLIHGL